MRGSSSNRGGEALWKGWLMWEKVGSCRRGGACGCGGAMWVGWVM